MVASDPDQVNIHPNPYSKEGMGQSIIDMGVAIAKLTTDMEWVKGTLVDIKKSLDDNDEELKNMLHEYQRYVEARLNEHNDRIKDLENFRAKIKGVSIAISAFIGSGLIVWLISRVFGG